MLLNFITQKHRYLCQESNLFFLSWHLFLLAKVNEERQTFWTSLFLKQQSLSASLFSPINKEQNYYAKIKSEIKEAAVERPKSGVVYKPNINQV